MSLSRHFPPSTQAILSAQRSPPLAKKRRDKSIIVISSSPEDNTLQQPPESSPQRIFSSDDEEFFGPVRPNSPAPPPRLTRKQSRQSVETLPLDVEDETFSRLLGEYKYTHPRPLTDTANIPRPSLQKVNLDGFFQETKISATKLPLHNKSRVKTTLTTRVSLPKRRIPTNTTEPTSRPASEFTPHASSREHVRFFTSWAAAQAPTTRAKPTAKPRRKATRKRDSVEVVLLSPRTGQESVRKRTVVHEIGERKLGEKGDGGSAMWDACKRGLDGELYDCEGEMVFSQELRQCVCDDEQEEGSLSVESGEVEVFELTDNQENCPSRNEEITTVLDTENRQRDNKMVIVDDIDTSLDIPLRHLTSPCPDVPLELTSQFDQSLEIIDITDLPPNQHHPQPTPTIPLLTSDSPLPIRPKSKQSVAPQSNSLLNYSTYTLPQLQVLPLSTSQTNLLVRSQKIRFQTLQIQTRYDSPPPPMSRRRRRNPRSIETPVTRSFVPRAGSPAAHAHHRDDKDGRRGVVCADSEV